MQDSCTFEWPCWLICCAPVRLLHVLAANASEVVLVPVISISMQVCLCQLYS
jgi:hypothetical protein